MRSKNVFEALPYSNVFMRYKECYELLQITIIVAIYDNYKTLPRLAFIIWDILAESVPALNGVIFNMIGQRNHKLWPYN